MSVLPDYEVLAETLVEELDAGRVAEAERLLIDMPVGDVVQVLEREDVATRAKLYRLLPRDLALEVFERLDPSMRTELFNGLRKTEVVAFFEEMDPDDRANLVGELPAGVANKLMRGLPEHERALTMPMLGYEKNSIGRYMSTEYVRVLPGTTVGDALRKATSLAEDAETIYTIIVTDPNRLLLGVVSLRRILATEPGVLVEDVMSQAVLVGANDEAETAARYVMREGYQAVPVVDSEQRLVGILTADDAYRILDRADDEDAARAGGTEALDRPYLATPVMDLVRSRIVWLFVLALSAILTVHVLDLFEGALSKVVTLALFIPLLIGTGGNAGSQAASTVTRALAVGEVRPKDIAKVFFREIRVGSLLGLLLGSVGFTIASLVFDVKIGAVIGLTLLSICTAAAVVGGMMPLLARAVKADPAVFSTPFIATFVDATGLIIYFSIAKVILGI